MVKILATAAVFAGLAGAAFADDAMDPMKMTCADFLAMDSDGMMASMEALHMASPDAAMAMDEMAMDTKMKDMVKDCDGKPDMMAMDAMMMQ